ncbi:uncharacterized protein LOC143888910 [Tasmannia lanceolata]|uniref:uncharacterized protein LOC143888910 n=1 Tax=Tasmannia lanceolata TaxID=3420 RepID=UPI00406376C8
MNLPIIHRVKHTKTVQWQKPDDGWMKLNTDASVMKEGAGIGDVIQDPEGAAIVAFSHSIKKDNIHLLELDAIYHGLHQVVSKNLKKIWVEFDSMMAVKTIEGHFPCPWKRASTVEKIKNLLSKCETWKISHIWREGNGAADYLSKWNCPIKGEQCDNFPDDFSLILCNDASGTLYPRV